MRYENRFGPNPTPSEMKRLISKRDAVKKAKDQYYDLLASLADTRNCSEIARQLGCSRQNLNNQVRTARLRVARKR